jgi:S-adenosylmethionine:diacylglycerol 3-amino-3-carboxypropyl transferase
VVTAQTPWSAGRLGSRRGQSRLLFGQMHEDAEIEHAAFRGKGRAFCIASAGDTALRLAEEHEVVACDINPAQLAYAESRANGGARRTGDAERAMNFARVFMPLVGWQRGVVEQFLALNDVSRQIEFWRLRLDTKRFRAGFDALLSRPVLRLMYTPQLLSFLPHEFGAVMRARWERGFALHPNAANPYARLLLPGESVDYPARAAAKVEFVLDDAATYLEGCAARSFDGFALSNILDGATAAYRLRLEAAVRRAASDDAVVVLRSFAEPASEAEAKGAARERSMLWGSLEVRQAREFGALS